MYGDIENMWVLDVEWSHSVTIIIEMRISRMPVADKAKLMTETKAASPSDK